jgi:AcrR family transcriptional regulator
MGLLLEVGPGRMRLADLARRLGVVPSALHYHFPGGKEEVITALFDREEARVVQAMTQAVSAADTPRNRLRALANARLQNATRLARLHQSDGTAPEARSGRETTTASEIRDYVMRRRQGFLDAERRLVAGILREAAGRRASASSIDLLAAAFQGALFNVMRTFSLTTNRKAVTILAELVDRFFDGIESA